MSRFCLNPAPIGSLLKQPVEKKRKAKPKRERSSGHLAAVRRLPCLSCDTDPAGEAAHIRATVAGKKGKASGIGIKPADEFTVPLCQRCHRLAPDAQHNVGEAKFWTDLGIDPIRLAGKLYATSPDVAAMREIVFKAREKRK